MQKSRKLGLSERGPVTREPFQLQGSSARSSRQQVPHLSKRLALTTARARGFFRRLRARARTYWYDKLDPRVFQLGLGRANHAASRVIEHRRRKTTGQTLPRQRTSR